MGPGFDCFRSCSLGFVTFPPFVSNLGMGNCLFLFSVLLVFWVMGFFLGIKNPDGFKALMMLVSVSSGVLFPVELGIKKAPGL